MSIIEDKKAARRELLALRKGFTEGYVQQQSQAVYQQLVATEIFQKARVVMGFLAFGHEIGVDQVLQEALRQGKTVAVPQVVSARQMLAAAFTGFEQLVLDRYGIRSVPAPVRFVAPEQLQVILVPGVGFSWSGQRLGMGAGYYDRFLASATGVKLGITCRELVRPALPVDAYDQGVDALVTAEGVHFVPKKHDC